MSAFAAAKGASIKSALLPVQADLLKALGDSVIGMSLTDLSGRTDEPRTCITLQLALLEKRGCVRKVGPRWRRLPAGGRALVEYDNAASAAEVLDVAQDAQASATQQIEKGRAHG